jgi:hypothetical protein
MEVILEIIGSNIGISIRGKDTRIVSECCYEGGVVSWNVGGVQSIGAGPGHYPEGQTYLIP